MKGAFLISRDIFENPIWNDVPKFRIFFYIVGNAVFSVKGVKKGEILIRRGQFLRSYRNLSKDLEYIENRTIKTYSTSLIKRKIDQLVKDERLEIEETELGTLFTVVNYSFYQGLENYKTTGVNRVGTSKEQNKNSSGTEDEQSRHNNNNEKNEENEKKGENDTTAAGLEEIVLNKYLELKGQSTPTASDYQAAKEIKQQGLPEEKAIQYLIDFFNKFERNQKHDRGKINSLNYCLGYMFDQYYDERKGDADEKYSRGNGANPKKGRGTYAEQLKQIETVNRSLGL